MSDQTFSASWIKVGGICGISSIASYLGAAFVPLPEVLTLAAAFAFGPLLGIGAMGLFHALSLEKRGPLLQIASVFALAGSLTVLIMLTTQQAIFALNARAVAAAADPQVAAEIQRIGEGLGAVHLGIDIAWDVLISVAVILFGIAMWRNPRFGRVFGGLGVVLGALLLGFNLHYFPIPPIDQDSIDWGPFVALWLLVAFILTLRVCPRETPSVEGR